MFKRYIALALLLICPSTFAAVIGDPEQFEWTFHPASATNPEPYYSGTMVMGEGSFLIGSDTITTRAYGQEGRGLSIPGPTMVMSPGNKYVLRFKNTLPYQPKEAVHNVFKDPNISNLHTHGLHISGMSPGDDVSRSFEGGFGGDFVYDIPADHMGGSYWYHAHHHGSTYLQVSGGAFGMLIIDDSNDNLPAPVANMSERHLVLGYLDPAVAGTGGDTLISGTLGSTWTINGYKGGTLEIPANTWQHWRILLADRDAKEKTVAIGSGCEAMLLARDGVWRTVAPRSLASASLSITGASRADLAVRCQSSSTLSVGNTKVADIAIAGTSDTSVHPFAADGSSWSARRPAYLADLRALPVANKEVVKMGARTINGSKFDHMVPTFSLSPVGVEEWQLQGAAMHPFHLHIYHVQMMGACGDFEDGEYYDVVSGNCTIRFDLNSNRSSVYQGRTIMHCHILEHEDQGAMGWANVLGGMGAPTFPADADGNFDDYFQFDSGTGPSVPAAPSGLMATTLSASQIHLTWLDNSSDETGFVLERSGGDGNFAPLVNLAPDSVSHTDSGLMPATTYEYRLAAVNAAGSSAYSNEVRASTDASEPGSRLVLGSLSVSLLDAGRGQKRGQALVRVLDDMGNPVAAARVSGYFSGDINESLVSDDTSANGETVIISQTSIKRLNNLSFCITDISHNNLESLSAAPGELCASL
ncbi:multicopper oxidase domain-containing protein [Shewanella sp.]|uniref:multicopper oxidase domain-containing protein n=1 Tax=Shewanella sp. TaxID=50422 RepID=UPI00356A1B72